MLNIKHSLSLHCATGQSLQLKSSVTVPDNNNKDLPFSNKHEILDVSNGARITG